ncbi:MAG: hypothetical protein PF447_09770, partial [Spirochaetaceae bacterium]|nr:hypothetical protein [Spirochaetaceae bacterium]
THILQKWGIPGCNFGEFTLQLCPISVCNKHRSDKTIQLEAKPVIILEGIMIFFDKKIREKIDLKIFVDTPADIRFIRRMKRDIVERGRTVDSVIEQYLAVVRPGHDEFIEPTKVHADLIVPEGGNNQKALNVLVSFINQIV